ncbi:MAG TPA: VOC family protein [Stellaceae bacterium]|jgi:catechol-2,3-dioxygenase
MSNSLPHVFAATKNGFEVEGISHIAVAVKDPTAARAFYGSVLGFDDTGSALPDCGDHSLVRAASGQVVALCRNGWRAASDTAVHNAYRVSPAQREAIFARLAQRGVTVQRYREDRPRENDDNCYFDDPDGNRIQLVLDPAARGPGVAAIDHVALQTFDIEWEEKLYIRTAGFGIEHVVGWRTTDHQRAKLWGEGKEEMMPGARRWDKRYTIRAGEPPKIARPNMQIYLDAGNDGLAVYLAAEHYRIQPAERLVGTPRVAFKVAAPLEDVAQKLAKFGRPVAGPIEHAANPWVKRSIYCRDIGGNFLEFCR